MPGRTFEERVGAEIDRLYGAACFLTCGEENQAERILTTAVVEAFKAHQAARPEDSSSHPISDLLDECLARTFLRSTTSHHLIRVVDHPRSAPRTTRNLHFGFTPPSFDDLSLAAEVLSPLHRVVFWLAALERLDYESVGESVGVGRRDVARLVREAHHSLQARLNHLAGDHADPDRRHRREM